jgi:hypothetical protein
VNVLVWAGGMLAILTYFPLWKGIKSGKVKQNLFTWLLWAILDGIVAVTIIAQNGNFLLPVAFTVGSVITSFFIVGSKNKVSWTWFETMVVLLVVSSMGVWHFSGDRVATIASTIAVTIAGIPQLIDAWKKPKDMPILEFVSYTIANGLSTAGGKNWSISERLFPASGTVFCLLIVVFSARKFWQKKGLENLVS